MEGQPYDKLAKIYDDYYLDVQSLKENRIIQEVLAGHVDHPVMDVGCGTGLLLELLDIKDYVGIDPTELMLNRFRIKFPGVPVQQSCFEAIQEYGGRRIISLFGSISYVHPNAVQLHKFHSYFLMFYAEHYTPSIYTVEPSLQLAHYQLGDYDLDGATLYEFSNYVIATNLELNHATLSGRVSAGCRTAENQLAL